MCMGNCTLIFFFFFNETLQELSQHFIYLFIFGCVGSSFLCEGFLQLRQAGPLFIVVHGPLTVAASLVAEHGLQTRRLSSCGSRAQLLRGMWDLPRPGLEPVFPALAGGFSTTAPPGKPLWFVFFILDIPGVSLRLQETSVTVVISVSEIQSRCVGVSNINNNNTTIVIN